MSILDIFRSTPAQQPAVDPSQQQQQVAVPPNQGNIPAVPTVAVDANGIPIVPAVVEQKDESPLAQFKDLWETAPVDPNKKDEPAAYVPPTAEEIQKAVGKVDFTKNFTSEQLAAVTAGGEEGQAALLQLLNTVGQQSLAHSTGISTKLNEQAMSAAIAEQVAKIPALVRAQSVQAHAKDTNPLFDNPAIQPFIQASQEQLQIKFPNDTPAQITEKVQAYITAMGEHFAPAPVVKGGVAADDWSDYLEKG
jgi:hypothetical protein